jgi:hypothetical protein
MLLTFVLATMAFLLASVVSTAPLAQPDLISPTEASTSVKFLANRSKQNSVNDCNDSTFESNSGLGSPLISDCLQIATNIAGGGTWEVETVTCKHHQLVQYGTCALGVRCCASDAFVNIGNQDIIDVIQFSVDHFAWNGTIAASGSMECQSGRAWDWLDWNIYHA